MQRTARLIYLDSSALVKLVINERESADLAAYLAAAPMRASCSLARVEVTRTAKLHGEGAVSRASEILLDTHLIGLDDDVLSVAADLASASLRTLDAIHVAAAVSLRDQVSALVTYDRRMAQAATSLGFVVESPGTT